MTEAGIFQRHLCCAVKQFPPIMVSRMTWGKPSGLQQLNNSVAELADDYLRRSKHGEEAPDLAAAAAYSRLTARSTALELEKQELLDLGLPPEHPRWRCVAADKEAQAAEMRAWAAARELEGFAMQGGRPGHDIICEVSGKLLAAVKVHAWVRHATVLLAFAMQPH